MDEREWLSSTDVQAMLRFVTGDMEITDDPLPQVMVKERISDRKLRLFAVACCRSVWHLLTDDAPCPKCFGKGAENDPYDFYDVDIPDTCRDCHGTGRINRSRRAVEVAERFADGEANTNEMDRAFTSALEVDPTAHRNPTAVMANQVSIAGSVAWVSTNFFNNAESLGLPPAAQADLLREIVGNPFRPLPYQRINGLLYPREGVGESLSERIDPIVWLTPQVLNLAQAAYEERRPARKCERCKGEAYLYNDYGGRMHCEDCHAQGRIDDGSLDPVRLSILADALEEAGCGGKACKFCGGEGRPMELARQKIPGTTRLGLPRQTGQRVDCPMCKGTGVQPNPLLAHLRSPGPHYRGCHVLDTLLAKS